MEIARLGARPRETSLAIGPGCPGCGGHRSTALEEKKRFGNIPEGFGDFCAPPIPRPRGGEGPPEPQDDVAIVANRLFGGFPRKRREDRRGWERREGKERQRALYT